jgi:hypothetical protein
MSQFRKKNADFIHLDTDCVILNRHRDIAEIFSKHFQSVYSSSFSGTYSSVNQCTGILFPVPISNSDVRNTIKPAATIKISLARRYT